MQLVSVIIPTFNRGWIIERSVRSVLAQTYQNFEIIIVDDGSSDNTFDVVKSFGDIRIRYMRHEKNLGGSAARNTGIKAAKGGYIAFLDSDDEWFPKKLEKQMEVFNNSIPDVGVVYAGWRWILDENKKIIQDVMPIHRGSLYEILLNSDCVGSNSIPLIRTNILRTVGGFDGNLPSRQDWDLWLRIAQHCEFDFVPEILVNYFIHDKSISSSTLNKLRGTEMILEKYADDFCKQPKLLARHYNLLSVLSLLEGDINKGRSYIFNSIKLDHTNWRAFVCLMFSFLGTSTCKMIFKYLKRIKQGGYYWLVSE